MGKKLAPYNLQVLTNDYLIDGTADGDTIFHMAKPDEMGMTIHLVNAKVQSTKTPPALTRTCARYVCCGKQALALIPSIDYTLLEYNQVWKLGKQAINGVFYLGPYWMTGRVTYIGPSFPSDLPAYDVRFGSFTAGSQWAGLTAPFALINTVNLIGWEEA